jgi:Uma2 family endonuclease
MAIDISVITADEFAPQGTDEGRTELIRGEVIRMPPTDFDHGDVQMSFGTLLKNHVKCNDLGRVVSEVGFRLETTPDTVLAPDIAFISHQRLTTSTAARHEFQDVAPELVVEIVSPWDYAISIERKTSIYLAAGVKAVIIVWPSEHKITLASHDRTSVSFQGDELVDLGAIVPGFSCRVSELFE